MYQELKASSKKKLCQGDVNIYALGAAPGLKGEEYKDPVLVYGNSGNHHKLEGDGFSTLRTKEGKFIVTVTGKKVSLTHQQHKPAHKLEPGVYLVDRAREKGVFDDMVNPVAD